jgi:hypothetical protein
MSAYTRGAVLPEARAVACAESPPAAACDRIGPATPDQGVEWMRKYEQALDGAEAASEG